MRKVISLLLLIVVLWVSFLNIYPNFPTDLKKVFSYSQCQQPITVKTGAIDPKFNLSKQNLITDINQAINVWNQATPDKLFIYDPNGTITVNLIYDERQSLNNQIKSKENQVENQKNSLKPQIEDYNKLTLDFKQKLAELKTQVEYWNNRGGAPEDIYTELIKKQQELEQEANQLNQMQKQLEISAESYNVQIDQLNQTINSYNSSIILKPEEGIFKTPDNIIEIYLNNDQSELIHTLAHELGHSLGLDHIENPKAIMFPFTTKTTQVSSDDIKAVEEVCKPRGLIPLLKNLLNNK